MARTALVLLAALLARPAAAFQPQDLLNRFAVLDPKGTEAPARLAGSVAAPFGVLVAVKDLPRGRFEVEACSAVHLKDGKGLTAAHCLPRPKHLWQYFVLYYDTNGKKAIQRVVEFPYIGENYFDIAVFSISDGPFPQWDGAGDGTKTFGPPPTTGVIDPVEAVTAWSYTPIEHFPDLEKKYRKTHDVGGMVFTPNPCLGSLQKPQIELWSKAKRKHPAKRLSVQKFAWELSPGELVFLDKCERPVVKGNSGALVALTSDFSKKIGVLSGVFASRDQVWRDIQRKQKSKRVSILYRGVDNRLEELRPKKGASLFSIVVRLDVLKDRAPRAFAPPPPPPASEPDRGTATDEPPR